MHLLYNYKTTSLVFKDATSGECHQIDLDVDLRNCKPLASFAIEDTVGINDIPPGKYNLFLKIADRSESLKNRIRVFRQAGKR